MRYQVLDETHDVSASVRRVREKHHPLLVSARIAVVVVRGGKPDADGHLKLGSMAVVSALDHELHEHDFVLTLNGDAYDAFGEKQRTALIDHELQHGAPVLEKDGTQAKDESTGRLKWRTRKHDIEEFTDVVARNGIWTKDLEAFAKEVQSKMDAPLFRDLGGLHDDEPAGAEE